MCWQVHATFMPSDLLKDLEGLRSQAGKTYPELQHLDLDGSNDVYPPDVEQEANEWFQKVYHDKLNIEDFVSMLKGWQVQLLFHIEYPLSMHLSLASLPKQYKAPYSDARSGSGPGPCIAPRTVMQHCHQHSALI